MTRELIFWVLMLLALVYGSWGFYAAPGESRRFFGMNFLTWVLLALLGWSVFGPAIR